MPPRPARDRTHTAILKENGFAMEQQWRIFVVLLELEQNQTLSDFSGFPLRYKSISSDEIGFVEIHREPKAAVNRCSILVDVVSPTAIGLFHAAAINREVACMDKTKIPAGLKQ